MENETQKESVEEAIFKTLSHQKRRDILRVVGEKKRRNVYRDQEFR